MTRILVIGDTHIPDRAEQIPSALIEYIDSGKPWDIVAFTGDFTEREILDWTYSLGREVYVVRGNMDYLPLPKSAVFNVGEIIFGIHHGDGVYPRGNITKLSEIASRLGAHVLLTGHTHRDSVGIGVGNKVLLLNPGSLTGVWGGEGGSYIPSLMVLNVNGGGVHVRTVRFVKNEIREIDSVAMLSNGVWRLA